MESPLIFWGCSRQILLKGDFTHGSIQLKCIGNTFQKTIQFFNETRIYSLVAGIAILMEEAQSSPTSQPLPPARLGEHCLGARWEMAFLQHVLGQPKGLLHVRHAQNTCTMGHLGDALNLCSNHLCWLMVMRRTKSSNMSLLHVWAPRPISKTSMSTQPFDHYVPSSSQKTDSPQCRTILNGQSQGKNIEGGLNQYKLEWELVYYLIYMCWSGYRSIYWGEKTKD